MKKVTAICIYKKEASEYIPVNFTVITRNGNSIDFTSIAKNEKHRRFNDMYRKLLTVLKANNFYVNTWQDFGVLWSDIQFIDIADSTPKFHNYSLNMEGRKWEW